jgi:hypothetical protein
MKRCPIGFFSIVRVVPSKVEDPEPLTDAEVDEMLAGDDD